MGDRARTMKNRRRVRLYGFITIAFLAFLGALILGMSIFGINLLGTNDEPLGRVEAPAPPDTTMYLTVPKIGLYDIPVLEGTSEAVLSQGVGHVPGTGFPWAEGSN